MSNLEEKLALKERLNEIMKDVDAFNKASIEKLKPLKAYFDSRSNIKCRIEAKNVPWYGGANPLRVLGVDDYHLVVYYCDYDIYNDWLKHKLSKRESDCYNRGGSFTIMVGLDEGFEEKMSIEVSMSYYDSHAGECTC